MKERKQHTEAGRESDREGREKASHRGPFVAHVNGRLKRIARSRWVGLSFGGWFFGAKPSSGPRKSGVRRGGRSHVRACGAARSGPRDTVEERFGEGRQERAACIMWATWSRRWGVWQSVCRSVRPRCTSEWKVSSWLETPAGHQDWNRGLAAAPVGATATTPAPPGQLDVAPQAAIEFESVFRRVVTHLGSRLRAPREVVWLNGAPGAGKGTNTPFIVRSRGLSRVLHMSRLLKASANTQPIIDAGGLVSDAQALEALLQALFDTEEGADGGGALVDGFPRTRIQVDYLRLLADKLNRLHVKNAQFPQRAQFFPRCIFKVVVLYVDEEESVRRQIGRGKMAAEFCMRAEEAGLRALAPGKLQQHGPRTTDSTEAAARRRYAIFRQHYDTLLKLSEHFPFHLIDAMGSVAECEAQIARELSYQSSLDLNEGTYNAIKHIPLSNDLVALSRQQLVVRLDEYCQQHPRTFSQVVALIQRQVIPQLRRCALAGHAIFESTDSLFIDHPMATDMLIDILSDRGFSVAHQIKTQQVPVKVDTDGIIESHTYAFQHFRISFEKPVVREKGRGPTEAENDQSLTISNLESLGDKAQQDIARRARKAVQYEGFANDEGQGEAHLKDHDWEKHMGYSD